jgi:uncharacterized phage infection (PIP) family protein YhgE
MNDWDEIRAILREVAEKQKKTEEAINKLLKDQEKTDAEIKALTRKTDAEIRKTHLAIVKLLKDQKKTDEQIKKTDEQIKKTDETIDKLSKKTDEEIKRTDEQIKKTDEQIKKTDEQIKKTDETIDKLSKKTDEEIKRTDEQIRRTSEEIDKLAQRIKETDRELREMFRKTDRELREMFRETDRMIKNIGKEVKNAYREAGGARNDIGRFVEGIMSPSAVKTFRKMKYKIRGVSHWEQIFDDKGRTITEIDTLIDTEKNGKKVLLVGEAKATMEEKDLREFIEKRLTQVKRYLSKYKDYDIIGFVCSVSYKRETDKKAIDEGIYVFRATDDVAKLSVPKNFKPKIW